VAAAPVVGFRVTVGGGTGRRSRTAVEAGRVRAGRETRTHAHRVSRRTSAERVRERGPRAAFERFVFYFSRNGSPSRRHDCCTEVPRENELLFSRLEIICEISEKLKMTIRIII